ncbi:acyltransferase family protein [Sphingomonas sp.]|uniref:acyltransferase family protein n=1 Tax=Sphingomonas sp. TaxID=28214 RepID=UPI002DD69BB2|nr:acyltransferase family protein [Sphingomonas sp.]
MARHYGMDWLRIGAFAILILYHIGMVFVPWPYHVKAVRTIDWVTVPMLFTSPWRLTLLFLVSGYASRALLVRSPGLTRFTATRTSRLLVPLAFGVAVIVPPQSWVELASQHGYARGYLHFWTRDFWRFGTLDGIVLPTWNHLWFVGYLWLYTLALAALLAVPRPTVLQRGFDRLFGGIGVVWVPILYLLIFQVYAVQRWADTHDVIGDLPAHLGFFPAFLFGFALKGSPAVMAALVRWRWLTALLALAAYAVVGGVAYTWPGTSSPPQWVADQTLWARQLQCWATIAALIGTAETYLNRDHRWRAPLVEGVFPFYLIHQTIIVVVAWWLRPSGWPLWAQFGILVAATAGGCWAFYRIGREIGWLRPLIGLRRGVAQARTSATSPNLPIV